MRVTCPSCLGTRTYQGESCGCGPWVKHIVDCGKPARPCPDCRTLATKADFTDLADPYTLDPKRGVVLDEPIGT